MKDEKPKPDSNDDDIFSHLDSPFDDEDWLGEAKPQQPGTQVLPTDQDDASSPGMPVEPEELEASDDTGSVGSTTMYSHLESDDLSRLRHEELASEVRLPVVEVERNIFRRSTKSGLEYFESDNDTGVNFFETLLSIGARHPLFWLLNLKAAGVVSDSVAFELGVDFLDQCPEEIRSSNSLHLVPFDDIAYDNPILGHLLLKESATCIASDLARDRLFDSLKFCSGWFLGTRTLGFHLESENSFLHSQIFNSIKFVVIPQLEPLPKWMLFNHPTSPLEHQEIGFPVIPK